MHVGRRARERVRRLRHRRVGDAAGELRQECLIVGDARSIVIRAAERRVLDADLDRHDRGEIADGAGDARLAVLIDAADDVADVRDLHAVALAADRANDRRVRHEVVDVAAVQERMAEAENLLAVHGRDRARRADGEVTVDDGDADRTARLQARVVERIALAFRAHTHRHEGDVMAHRHVLLQEVDARPIEARKVHDGLGLLRQLFLVGCSRFLSRGIFRWSSFGSSSFCRYRLSLLLWSRSILSLGVDILAIGVLNIGILRRLVIRVLGSCSFGLLCLSLFLLGLRLSGRILRFVDDVHDPVEDGVAIRLRLLVVLFLGLGLFLLAVFHDLVHVDCLKARLVLRIRHRPELHHVLDWRDEERVRRHLLDARRHGADEAAIDVDGAAAHALQDAARLLNHGAARACHDHAGRSLAIVHIAHDIHIEAADLARAVHHGIGRARHATLDILERQNGVHRVGRHSSRREEHRSDTSRDDLPHEFMQTYSPRKRQNQTRKILLVFIITYSSSPVHASFIS